MNFIKVHSSIKDANDDLEFALEKAEILSAECDYQCKEVEDAKINLKKALELSQKAEAILREIASGEQEEEDKYLP
ncbi:hypothetical protein SOV_17510 [Sporomusa ovata DSM 2662]|uniref:Uncharacterized protein n=1 Tax=Sporomusa ovata TaxID=2378 RepID=A0A0U1KVD9_9FIRM|nr:hypothetical protein [Sporomusa ovata]EQB29351.1 hypothetical protein SOV_1c10840 [Sporomusa ovata DSM 2662]CQR71398.1 hypothetical protein SpAn4DRAFT_3903 [Sporomusa ovata]